MKQDLVLAATSNYTWAQVGVWAVSLSACFSGRKVVIIYDENPENLTSDNQQIGENLIGLGFEVYCKQLIQDTVYNQRFLDFYQFLRDQSATTQRAVVTDIRDIFFQADPFIWMDANMRGKLLATSEGLRYRDETWGATNVTAGYPLLAERVMDRCIYNVGVLAGEASHLADLTLAIALIAKASGYPVADQSGFNILLDMEPYRQTVQLVGSEEGFACQAGTFADPTKITGFRPNLLEPEPRFEDGLGVLTNAGKLYPIVHQYDRVPEWNHKLQQLLHDRLTNEGGS